MNKKILILSILLIFSLTFINYVHATDDVIMDLNTSTANQTSTGNAAIDNTIYSSNSGTNENTIQDPDQDVSYDNQIPATTSTEDYDNSADLSITNMINIILIVVGVVIILLGIAIIIKLK